MDATRAARSTQRGQLEPSFLKLGAIGALIYALIAVLDVLEVMIRHLLGAGG